MVKIIVSSLHHPHLTTPAFWGVSVSSLTEGNYFSENFFSEFCKVLSWAERMGNKEYLYLFDLELFVLMN